MGSSRNGSAARGSRAALPESESARAGAAARVSVCRMASESAFRATSESIRAPAIESRVSCGRALKDSRRRISARAARRAFLCRLRERAGSAAGSSCRRESMSAGAASVRRSSAESGAATGAGVSAGCPPASGCGAAEVKTDPTNTIAMVAEKRYFAFVLFKIPKKFRNFADKSAKTPGSGLRSFAAPFQTGQRY